MEEVFVQLLCPTCQKSWESSPRALPDPPEPFECSSCGDRRPLVEFVRTERGLETLRRLG